MGPGPDRRVVFQSYSLFPWRSVASNVAFGLECLRLGRHVWHRTGATVLMVTHDVGEALYLSKRVVVLSSRSGRVAEVVEVPFGRSRGPEVRRDRRFLDLEDEIDDLLRQAR